MGKSDRKVRDPRCCPPSMCPFEEDWRFPCGWCGTTLEGDEDKVRAHMEICPDRPSAQERFRKVA